MAKFITEADIKPALKFATGSTKKLVTAGVNADDKFPELLSKYKWSGTRDYNMAMIIIAFYAYCAQQDDETLREFGISARYDQSKKSVFEFLEDGKGVDIMLALQKKGFNNVMDIILQKVDALNGETKERVNITADFLKQVKKITPWKINQGDVHTCIVNLTNKIQNQNEKANNDILAAYEELKLSLQNALDESTKQNEKLTDELKTNKEISEKRIKELESKLSTTKTTLANLGKNHNINTAELNAIIKQHPDLNNEIIAQAIEKIAQTKEFKNKIATAQKATDKLEQEIETKRQRYIANQRKFNQTNPQGAPTTRKQSMFQNKISFFEKEGPIKPRSNTNTANVTLDTEREAMNQITNLSQQLARHCNQDLNALSKDKLDKIINIYKNKTIANVVYSEKLPEIKADPEKNIDQYLKELKAFADAIKNYATAGGNDPQDFKTAMKTFGESTKKISNALQNIKFYVGKELRSKGLTTYSYRYVYGEETLLKNGNQSGIEYSNSLFGFGKGYYYKTEATNAEKAESYLKGEGGYIIA